MSEVKVTKKQVRRFLVKYHGLSTNIYKGESGVLEFISKVGCIQYDPLNVVGRNPDLVLQSRVKKYQSKYLYDLLYKDRKLLDGWDKQMGIYPVEDYQYFYSELKVKERVKSIEGTLKYRDSIEALAYIDEVIKTLDEQGPLKPSQIDLGGIKKKGSWGHSKYSSIVMDYLYNKGDLVIDHKVGVQKVYDLASKKLPNELLVTKNLTEEELHKWHFYRRVGSVGLIWNKRGGAWLESYLADSKTRERVLNQLVEEGLLTRVKVEDIKTDFYIKTCDLDLIFDETPCIKVMKFIAPLDNIIWDRKMTKELFNFEYTWEVYTPVVKRKYGYYVLPVLYGDKFIARFEPKIDKQTNSLVVENWWWEENVRITKTLLKAREKALKEFCKYLGLDSVVEN